MGQLIAIQVVVTYIRECHNHRDESLRSNKSRLPAMKRYASRFSLISGSIKHARCRQCLQEGERYDLEEPLQTCLDTVVKGLRDKDDALEVLLGYLQS